MRTSLFVLWLPLLAACNVVLGLDDFADNPAGPEDRPTRPQVTCVDPARDCAQPQSACMTAVCEAGVCLQMPRLEPSIPCSTSLLGVCAEGQQRCDAQGNPVGECVGKPPRSERCDVDELDEDCDGEINESGSDCTCGDGYVSAGETCDDRGTLDGDRCSARCQSERVQQISVSVLGACALLHDGRAKCWGDNKSGDLGQGDNVNRGVSPDQMGEHLAAIDLGSRVTVTAIASGGCAILSNGRVKCWGLNSHGRLALGHRVIRGDAPGQMGDNLPAVELGTNDPAKAISVSMHACALMNAGDVRCWGRNDFGQLGLGDTESRGDDPDEMGYRVEGVDLGTDSGIGRKAVAVAAGGMHTCALLEGGIVKCWGNNVSGQLGLGDTESRGDGPGEMGHELRAVELGDGERATAIAAGYAFTCALLMEGTVKCWGENSSGQLGRGDKLTYGDQPGQMGNHLSFVPLGTDRRAKAIAAGDDHACAILTDGSVKCWGRNHEGQLGLGDMDHRGDHAGEMGNDLPTVQLGKGRTATAISAGISSTCALLDDGSVKCWGSNRYGELGLGDAEARGDGEGEMGDNLPTVKLYSELW